MKTVDAESLQKGVRVVAEGEAIIDPAVTRRLLNTFAGTRPKTQPQGYESLTQREKEIFDCLGEGLTNRQIARKLHIEETTVKTHVSRVLMKLGLRSRVQAAVLAQSL